MAALLTAALAASIAVASSPPQAAAGATASGAAGVFSLPTATPTPDGRVSIGVGFDWWRGGNFLLPGATSQRTGATLTGSLGLLGGTVEAFGALSLRSTNLFSPGSRRTLISAGDADLGVKLLVPGQGPFSAGVLLEADLPSGVGGFSLKGTGGRAAALLGWSGWLKTIPVALSALMGYRIDNSAHLTTGIPATLPAFALGISSYDVVQGGATLQVPLRYGAPAAEVALDSPVGRQRALPSGERPLRARLALGVAQLHLDSVPELRFSAAVQLSLTRAGRISDAFLPAPGFAPDPPWAVLAAVSWSFEPRRARELMWHKAPAPAPEPVRRAAPPPTKERAVLHVVVLDAKTQLPLAGAWVSFVEGSDVGGTTGPEGKVRVEAEAGPVTVAVARDGYELLTETVSLQAGDEKQLTLSLQPVAPDATLRGRLVGEDGTLLRAAVFVSVSGTLPALPAEPEIFDGAFSFPVQHGKYELNAYTPGYRSTPLEVEAHRNETVSRDLVLRRIAGEPRAHMGATALEVAAPLSFVTGTNALQLAALPLIAEVAQALKNEARPLEVTARVAASEMDDEAAALTLSEDRARSVVQLLRERGVRAQLTWRGAGFARAGQPLVEIRLAAPDSRPRAEEAPRPTQLSSRGIP
jgi:hypothetical protein